MKVSFPFLVFALCMSLPLSAQQPARLLSLSPEGDEYLEIFAAPDRILGLHRYADDDRYSRVSEDFRKSVPGRAAVETSENMAKKPGLVIYGPETDPSAAAEYKKAGIPLEMLRAPGSWEDIRVQTLRMARVLRKDPARILDILHNRKTSLEKDAKAWNRGTPVPVRLVNFPLDAQGFRLFREILGSAGLQLLEGNSTGLEGTVQDQALVIFPGTEKEKILTLPLFPTRGPSVLQEARRIFEAVRALVPTP